MEPHVPTFFAINYLDGSMGYGGIESWGRWRIVFDAMRLFFKTTWAIGFYFREDAVIATGEMIKLDRVVDGSGKMSA
jgi:hypothetical protein